MRKEHATLRETVWVTPTYRFDFRVQHIQIQLLPFAAVGHSTVTAFFVSIVHLHLNRSETESRSENQQNSK